MSHRLRVAGLAVAGTLAVAGCGGNTDTTTKQGSGSEHAGHQGMQHGSDMAGMSGGQGKGMAGMAMRKLADETADGMTVELAAMAPETFFVYDGGGWRRHAPAPDDAAHLMVTLSDAKTGEHLPDATVTARIIGPDGRTVYDAPMYPMIGRGMGLHYGDNVPLPKPGRYTASLVVGPPKVGRHMDLRNAWRQPVRLQETFQWTGRM